MTLNLDWDNAVRRITPGEVRAAEPVPAELRQSISEARSDITRIISGDDHRFLVIAGPCSIHSEEAAVAYATRLARLQTEVNDVIKIAMRVYMEKPRTTLGWTGLISDPYMDGSGVMNDGLIAARRILRRVSEVGVDQKQTVMPCAVEFLDLDMPYYLGDLVGWGAIGARTVESQRHRHMASALTLPVGLKNNRQGDTQASVDAMIAAAHAHTIPVISDEGVTVVANTAGNTATQPVLRGTSSGPNYDADTVVAVRKQVQNTGINGITGQRVLIDCSHDNTRPWTGGDKDPLRQGEVFESVVEQYMANGEVCGGMLESHIKEGKQSIDNEQYPDPFVSVTDPCIDIAQTEELVHAAAHTIRGNY